MLWQVGAVLKAEMNNCEKRLTWHCPADSCNVLYPAHCVPSKLFDTMFRVYCARVVPI